MDSLWVSISSKGCLLKKSLLLLIAAISIASIPMSEPLVPAPISDRFFIIFIGITY